MNYTRKTHYKAILWTGKNQKEVAEFLGKKFVLKKDPIDPLKMDIYTKEKNHKSICCLIVSPDYRNA